MKNLTKEIMNNLNENIEENDLLDVLTDNYHYEEIIHTNLTEEEIAKCYFEDDYYPYDKEVILFNVNGFEFAYEAETDTFISKEEYKMLNDEYNSIENQINDFLDETGLEQHNIKVKKARNEHGFFVKYEIVSDYLNGTYYDLFDAKNDMMPPQSHKEYIEELEETYNIEDLSLTFSEKEYGPCYESFVPVCIMFEKNDREYYEDFDLVIPGTYQDQQYNYLDIFDTDIHNCINEMLDE